MTLLNWLNQKIKSEKSNIKMSAKHSINDNKVFCIGFGKTGTTSLEKALLDIGYKMGNQAAAEMLVTEVAEGNVDRLIKLCRTASAFQDIPFNMPKIYRNLDEHFPNSKFILTERNSSEEWYESLVKFHIRLFSSTDGLPSVNDLKASLYRYQGFLYEVQKGLFGIRDFELYDPEIYQTAYNKYNEDVKSYFAHRPNDLLVLNLTDEDSYQNLCRFLNVNAKSDGFPWLNKRK